MICADFFRNEHDRLVGFRITGHAGYADYGEDVCCASVSSAVMLTANTVTEAFKIKADVAVEENEIILRLENDSSEEGDKHISNPHPISYYLYLSPFLQP